MTIVPMWSFYEKSIVLSRDNVVLAYEPVWTIGTGKVASLLTLALKPKKYFWNWLKDNVGVEVAATTRFRWRFCNGANCKELDALSDIDGFLVGGASLKLEFMDIVKSASMKQSD